MSVRMVGCRDCEAVTSGDCGKHKQWSAYRTALAKARAEITRLKAELAEWRQRAREAEELYEGVQGDSLDQLKKWLAEAQAEVARLKAEKAQS